MHHIYTTEAIVIKSLPQGEANRVYFLFTKDLGLIKATAQGVRLSKSKLNSHLQTYSIVKVSVVKGKSFWRITSVESILQKKIKGSEKYIVVFHNCFNLILRLVHGEEKNEKIFDCVASTLFACQDINLSKDEIESLEVITVLRIMHFLGYIKKIGELSIFAENTQLSEQIIKDFISKKKDAVLEINKALKETHL